MVLLQRARQVGKTTLVRGMSEAAGSRRTSTLDDAVVLSAAERDPEGFVAAVTGPVTIDEMQRAPGLFRAIKASVDRDRKPRRFLLAGSANVVLLPAWCTNRSSRLAKAAKVLIVDSGLACYLVGARQRRLEEDGSTRGAMLENLITMEIQKQREWSRTRPSLYHFRSATGAEVDLVLEDRAGRVVGIEIKSARTVGADAFRGLRALRELAGKKFVRGILLHDGLESVSFDPTLMAAPHAAVGEREA